MPTWTPRLPVQPARSSLIRGSAAVLVRGSISSRRLSTRSWTAAASASKIRVRPGFDPESDLGPLVSEEQLNRVCGYLESGAKEGAKAVTGGSRQGTTGYFVQPTVLVNTNPKMKVVQEEIFGPVVTAIPFSAPNEIVATANDSIYGLAAGIWTRDIKKAHRVASKIK